MCPSGISASRPLSVSISVILIKRNPPLGLHGNFLNLIHHNILTTTKLAFSSPMHARFLCSFFHQPHGSVPIVCRLANNALIIACTTIKLRIKVQPVCLLRYKQPSTAESRNMIQQHEPARGQKEVYSTFDLRPDPVPG